MIHATLRKISRKEYADRIPELRARLIQEQFRLRHSDRSLLVILGGNDRQGLNQTYNLLHDWLDAKFLHATVFRHPEGFEAERPPFWRYWLALPPVGQVGVYLGAYTLRTILDRFTGRIEEKQAERTIRQVRDFERCLLDSGVAFQKYWLHLDKKRLEKQLRKARRQADQPDQILKRDRRMVKNFEQGWAMASRVLEATSTERAPWHLLENTGRRSRNLLIGETLLQALRSLREPAAESRERHRTTVQPARPVPSRLETVDLSSTLPFKRYKKKLRRSQRDLLTWTRLAQRRGLTTVLVFEGWDAAGKGGVIRRLTAGMDAQNYRAVPIGPPTEEERAHHYLWRFWRQLPRAGKVILFDRSWYGRVLVERVEGLAEPAEWRRSYEEINDFEQQLVEHGYLLLKFWLHLDPDEQWNRFQAREQTPHKQHKITPEDYRNRERWPKYAEAVEDMLDRTDRAHSPWHLIPSNDKRWARVQVLRLLCRALEERLG